MRETLSDCFTDLGVRDLAPPLLFRSEEELDSVSPPIPQSHALRRAFRLMSLDGILCLKNAPIVYLKTFESLDNLELRRLQFLVWNQGIAAVLIVLSRTEVRVYSGLVPPSIESNSANDALIKTLSRIADSLELSRFFLSFETGEFFRVHAKAFNPELRVDRRLLDNLSVARDQLNKFPGRASSEQFLDALLCRVVFTCYLVDRGIIGSSYFASAGVPDARSLKEIFEGRDADEAQRLLYRLFENLRKDFNGDLFGNLDQEQEYISSSHIECLGRFLSGEELSTGQLSFLTYDFSVIPIEAVSAIYERFLSSEVQDSSGAIYTPRFLAENVIDIAIEGMAPLLGKRFLDPACGSGIFLVGIFNRLAEEWRRENKGARYDLHAEALIRIVQENIFGIDRNKTACRIAAFSLYLALLDQLSPSDIRELQCRGKFLPPLVFTLSTPGGRKTILQSFFGQADTILPVDGFDVVLGNPPWVSRTGKQGSGKSAIEKEKIATEWPFDKDEPVAQKQISYRFIWKAARHLRPGGRVCFLLPCGLLFNHDSVALSLQLRLLSLYSVDRVVNLADLRFQLFEDAIHPALIVRYGNRDQLSNGGDGSVVYLTPKTNWASLWADVITIDPDDYKLVDLKVVKLALMDQKVPTVWKERFWGTPRDWKLLDRLSLLPQLRQVVGQPHKGDQTRWIIGQGFQPMGTNDDASGGKEPWPGSEMFVRGSYDFDLVLLQEECEAFGKTGGRLRRKPAADAIFDPPHVLVSKGLKVAYSDFRVVFQHAIQGIHGSPDDEELLMFLAAVLHSSLAKYFFFHTSANWGVERPEVHLEELLRAPFPLPCGPQAKNLVHLVANRMRELKRKNSLESAARAAIVASIAGLIYQYYEIDGDEQVLIRDTVEKIIPSVTPRRESVKGRSTYRDIPVLDPCTKEERAEYLDKVRDVLNRWAAKPI